MSIKSIDLPRLKALHKAFKLELSKKGRSRPRTAFLVLREMGYSGSKKQILEQLENDIAKMEA